ncbi:MAG: lysophospholipid acyltransferase family protein [Desulfobacterales bacterium]|jgi:Kdo2-lipid IVA lauroyltransferase/acyltransferase|nr:lysophospholipid acyltransferase family protein [Desulfobacterales bacterium]
MEERHPRSINRFIYLFFFQFCSTLIPRSIQKFFSVVVGDLFYLLMKKTRAHVRKNIEGVSRGRWSKERVNALTRKTFQNYGQYLLDYMVMHRLHPSNKNRWIAEEGGGDYMIEALRAGKGVICITPHLGNWEIGGLLFAFKGGKLNVLTLDERDLDTRSFREEMRRRRGIKNLYINPKEDSPMAILDAVKALRRNEIVAMLGDRVESQKTMVFDFFGRKTAFPIGVAILAMATEAPVLPVFVVMEKNRKYRGIIEPSIYFNPSSREDRETVIREGMERLIKKFEEYIEKYPDQWYNFYSYWNETLRQA